MNYDRLLQLGGIDREIPPIPQYISKEYLQQEIDEINATLIPESLPDVHDYTSWDLAGTTQGGAGAMVVVDETGYKTILAITSSYIVTNMPVGEEKYIASDAVLDGETLITVYNDAALTVDSNIKVKISAERKSTIEEALTLVYYSARSDANQYTDEGLSTKLDNVDADALFDNNIPTEQQKQAALQALLQLEQMYGYTSTVSTNPEYTYVILDSEDRILGGKKVNGDLELFGTVYPANP